MDLLSLVLSCLFSEAHFAGRYTYTRIKRSILVFSFLHSVGLQQLSSSKELIRGSVGLVMPQER